MTKQELDKYIHLRFELENIEERILRLKSAEEFATSAKETAGCGSHQTNPNRMSDAVIQRLDYEQKMRGKIADIMKQLTAIDDAINAVADPLERECLRLRYCEQGEKNRHKRWEDIALEIYGDCDEKHLLSVYRLHGRALMHIGVI